MRSSAKQESATTLSHVHSSLITIVGSSESNKNDTRHTLQYTETPCYTHSPFPSILRENDSHKKQPPTESHSRDSHGTEPTINPAKLAFRLFTKIRTPLFKCYSKKWVYKEFFSEEGLKNKRKKVRK